MRFLEHRGRRLPVMGQGTWRMGEDPSNRTQEVRALQLGVDLGMTLIDTAEMYASGGSESVVGEAVAGRRDVVYLVSKVMPANASYRGTKAAAEASLKRLGVDHLDLYLLHWVGSHPLADTVRAFEELKREGKIADWGVSNFDHSHLQELAAVDDGAACASNQILYNLSQRGPDFSLISRCRTHDMHVMAYSPVKEGRLKPQPVLEQVAQRHGVSPFTVALAWTIREDMVITIPKAVREDHLRQNLAAVDVRLTAQDVADLDAIYPPPAGESSLDTA